MRQRSRASSRERDAGEHVAVDGREALGGRRRERAQLRVHVRRAGLDLAVVGGGVQVQVAAHEALVVGAPAREVRRDAHDVPVGGELARILRVEAQRAPARLVHGHAGGRHAEVDEAVDGRAVPALAEQRRGCSRARRWCRARAAAWPARPRRAAPTPRPCERSVDSTPSGSALHSGRLRRRRPRLERGEQQLGVLGDAAQPAAGDEQRPQRRGAHVAGERRDRVPRGAGGRVEHAGERVVGARGGELGVAQHEPAQRVAARLHLAAITSTSPSAFACEPVSSRSTSEVPRRIPGG